ncbi:MAG: hypothetical protein ABIG87_00010 [Patescibacteria group bacterium]
MKTIASLGVSVAIIPFLGIPVAWKTVIFVIIGITILSKALIYKNKNKSASDSREEPKNNVYVENGDFNERE